MLKIKNNKLLYLFLIFLILILIEGLTCQPNIGRKVFHESIGSYVYPTGEYIIINLGKDIKFTTLLICKDLNFLNNFWEENGFVENLQAIFLFIAIFILIKIKLQKNKYKIFNIFLILKIVALTYYLGEEISWGQHFFLWSTSDWFNIYNNQKETNLHNISNLLDQFPRTLVMIWCSLSIFLLLLYNKFFLVNKNIYQLIFPGKNLILISWILIILIIPDLIVDKLNLHPGWVGENGRLDNNSYFYDMLTFNFIRLSELHELLFTFYFLYHAKLLAKRNY